MQLSAEALKEFDEELPVTMSDKGFPAHYKVNHKTKQVFVKTAEGDGNDHEWRHTNGGYEALMERIGRGVGQAVASGVQSSKPIEAVPVAPEFAPPKELGE